MRRLSGMLFVLALQAAALGEELPQPIFYLPFDGGTAAAVAGGGPSTLLGAAPSLSRGGRQPRLAVAEDDILALARLAEQRFGPGKVGQCYDAENAPLLFGCAGNFRADEGACSLWLSPSFRGDDKNIYCALFGAADWGMLYKYRDQSSLTFGTARPGRDLYYDCVARDIGSWQPGEWHHVVTCWSRHENRRRIYVDGKCEAQAPFPFSQEIKEGILYVGCGCSQYAREVANAKLDEFALWDRPLDDAAVRRLCELGSAGRPLCSAPAVAAAGLEGPRLKVARPESPGLPGEAPAVAPETPTREALSLDGWWHFLPREESLIELPAQGWGLTRVPGYWTSPENMRGPDGRPAKGKWAGRPLSDFSLAYHQRVFVPRAEWKDRSVFLQFGGVDGLADIFLNGERLGRLPSWEDEAYDVGPRLRFGQENVLTVALYRRGDCKIAGIFGRVRLLILPRAFVSDVTVRPSVGEGRIRFSASVWSGARPAGAKIEFEVVADSSPGATAKSFSCDALLAGAARARPELSAQVRRVERTFDWKDAHLWTYDDPFLYRVRTRLYLDGNLVDESPSHRFGFREFTMRGSEFFLNGKPTHLRGHQVDFGWPDQMPRVKEIKSAGMNCFELSGPVRCDWYAGTPYREDLFKEVLDYADEHGLIAMPILPDAKAIKERIFDPKVAELYRQRVEKHIRRWGDHPSIGLWYMHFNLAGYHWYIAPMKIDGSCKPADEGFRKKERYALEAQRIARAVDPRPIYHHACGNFGDIYTLNCYLGPTCPLQEREEWPLRWAEKRPFPLMAVEHCLMLIPYWFRERQFPLSKVYASEPIFDELTAKHLGPRAYPMITPELFDLYDVDRKPRGTRTRELIAHHPGYQEVKAIFARRSLRSWRTFGVSGIVFNAENWDFKGADGRELPVMKAFRRYFGDTDLYIAGPGQDWPSKDHCFFAGETVRKQVVLLNDLTRDIPCLLEWRLKDGKGRVRASGRINATARAGTPTMYPMEFTAPVVKERTDLVLRVEVVAQPGSPFLPEEFELAVFPARAPGPPGGRIAVFDPVGETSAMLGRAGIAFDRLTDRSDLRAATTVIVGKKAFGEPFLSVAEKARLEEAVQGGLNLLVFEQTTGEVFGLKIAEQSAREVFAARPDHPFLNGLVAADLMDLRGRSDLIPPYPDAPPETEKVWPKRFFKWGNRGVVATFVYTKPHYAPFGPVLECGFDLVNSPLLEAKIGRGRVVLCQVDATSRYGTDPVSTRMVDNLITELSRRGEAPAARVVPAGDSAREFLGRFGIVPVRQAASNSPSCLIVGTDPPTEERLAEIERVVRDGGTVLFLPNAPSAKAFGVKLKQERFFIGRLRPSPLLAGLNDGDLYLKKWTTMPAACAGNGWEILAEPGMVAVKKLGRGTMIACQLDLQRLDEGRGVIKALRFWNALLSNLGVERPGFARFLRPSAKCDEPNAWEQIPPYMDW